MKARCAECDLFYWQSRIFASQGSCVTVSVWLAPEPDSLFLRSEESKRFVTELQLIPWAPMGRVCWRFAIEEMFSAVMILSDPWTRPNDRWGGLMVSHRKLPWV